MCKVKICGLSRKEDIDAVNRVLPDYIGFVFAPSRRRVDEGTAAALRERLDGRIQSVGVFVNRDIEFVAGLYRKGVINLAQLHGDENGEYVKRLKEMCGCPVIKSVGIGGALPVLPEEPDYLLFDALSAQRGGTGEAFDWNVIKGYKTKPYFLAGGLTIENLTGALKFLNPYCVDVSSGVETDGVKDPGKIENFIQIARSCSAE